VGGFRGYILGASNMSLQCISTFTVPHQRLYGPWLGLPLPLHIPVQTFHIPADAPLIPGIIISEPGESSLVSVTIEVLNSNVIALV
jgi:hypothetical protein